MLTKIDRIQIAVHDTGQAAAGWIDLLGAELRSSDTVRALSAKRSTYRVGRSEIEFLEPDGAGPIEDALRKRGRAHLYAAGASTSDFDQTLAHLRSQGIEPEVEGGQAYLNAADRLGVDFPLVLTPDEDRPCVGSVDFLYEVTLVAGDAHAIATRLAQLFGLDDAHFEAIHSEHFQYSGILTLFSADNLHRFEIICPSSEETTMGRFLKRHGPSFYMAFAEAHAMPAIEQRAIAADTGATGATIDKPPNRDAHQPADQMWLHPSALGGVMLGLSRPTMAWKWSGHPERVKDLA